MWNRKVKQILLISAWLCLALLIVLKIIRQSADRSGERDCCDSETKGRQATVDVSAMDCESNHRYITQYPPKGRHGKRPLENFYLSFDSRNVTHFDVFANDYREANIAFVHLPKCGGTSVEKVLLETPGLNYKGKRAETQLGHCREFYQAANSHNVRKGKALYYSKRTYGIHNYVYPDRQFMYVTWFRHPVERIVSAYHFLMKHNCFGERHKLCKRYLYGSKNVTDYLKKAANVQIPEFDNNIIRLLLFDEFPEVTTSFEDCCGAAKHVVPIEEKHYLRAKENLEQRMAFVGILEDWKTSQDMLTLMLNIQNVAQEVHVNANSHRTELSEYELTEIERRNYWDLKLYTDAQAMYEKQREAYFKVREQIF